MYRTMAWLHDILRLEPDGEDQYYSRARSVSKQLFGGQVAAMSLKAANESVDLPMMAHSMHCYFLRLGDTGKKLNFSVERIRDGRSFATRRVVASQDDKAIFSAMISYQKPEKGVSHQHPMPEVPAPESLMSDDEYFTELDRQHPGRFGSTKYFPVEVRPVHRRDALDPQPSSDICSTWIKLIEPIGDDPREHQVMLTYMSDMTLLGAALRPHPYNSYTPGSMIASLDHAIWFQGDCRADEWVLYHQDSPVSGNARGFSRGSFYTQDGRLVGSTVQESLQRLPLDS